MINCVGGVQVLFPLLEFVTSDNNNEVPLSSDSAKESPTSDGAGGGGGSSSSPVTMVDGRLDDEWEILPSSSYSGRVNYQGIYWLYSVFFIVLSYCTIHVYASILCCS